MSLRPARRRHRPPAMLASTLAALAMSCGPALTPSKAPDDEPRAAAAATATAEATFEDESACAGCHAAEAAAWTGSHHDLAMQPASESAVLGDFADASFARRGAASRFFRRDGRFFVVTEGPDGRSGEFEITDTFGVTPLQQYLIPMPGGRKQAFGVAWATQEKRWFDLHPERRMDARDPLHWTRRDQTWNWQCAGCHATGLVRGWDATAGGYRTTAARFDVGCQACHGPGSAHVAAARAWQAGKAQAPPKGASSGLVADLASRDSTVEVETCARCHSRRAPLRDGERVQDRLMDDHLPALLDEGLYHADGQILDEVFEYGSFVQSRMHARGVRCSDCHDPHGLGTRAPGNATCVACHSPAGAGARPHVNAGGLQRKDYDAMEHHHHVPGRPGSACVDCHAPARTYMVVDPRRDHSFRIPRPDISAKLGTPDACTTCHADRTPAWAAESIAKWYGPQRRSEPHWGQAIDGGRRGLPGAATALHALAMSADAPAIARATALSLLARYPGAPTADAWRRGLRDADPIVRRAAVLRIGEVPPQVRADALAPLLADPVRGVRIAAARALVGTPGATGAAFDTVLAEYEEGQRALGGQPEALLALALLRQEQGRLDEAEPMVRDALRLDPSFPPCSVNLADLLASSGREAEAASVLRAGLLAVHEDETATLHHALGLSLVRRQRLPEALAELALAADLAPLNPRFGFVHAVALHDSGRTGDALLRLRGVVERCPWDRDARLTLGAWLRDAKRPDEAAALLDDLRRINPADPALR